MNQPTVQEQRDPIHGRCLCGAITFRLTPPTEFCSHCHCESCRRAHGAAFVTWTAVPEERFSLTSGAELLGRYRSSERAEWGFCTRCGSSLLYFGEGKAYVTVANLLDPLDRGPEGHVSYEERVPWVAVRADGLPCFRGKSTERLEP